MQVRHPWSSCGPRLQQSLKGCLQPVSARRHRLPQLLRGRKPYASSILVTLAVTPLCRMWQNNMQVSCDMSNAQVTVWWPAANFAALSDRAEQTTSAVAVARAAVAAAQTVVSPVAEGFSSETARILRSLGEPAGPAAPSDPSAVAARAAEPPEAVAAEQLRHPAPLLSVQWSPGTLQSGAWPSRMCSLMPIRFMVGCQVISHAQQQGQLQDRHVPRMHTIYEHAVLPDQALTTAARLPEHCCRLRSRRC